MCQGLPAVCLQAVYFFSCFPPLSACVFVCRGPGYHRHKRLLPVRLPGSPSPVWSWAAGIASVDQVTRFAALVPTQLGLWDTSESTSTGAAARKAKVQRDEMVVLLGLSFFPRQDGMVRDKGHTWLPDCGALADVHNKSACIRHRNEEEKARGLTTSCSRRVGLASGSNASPASDVSNLSLAACLTQRMGTEPTMTCSVTHISRTGSCMQRGWRGAADYRVLCCSFTVVFSILATPSPSCSEVLGAALHQRQLADGPRATMVLRLSTRSCLANPVRTSASRVILA